MPRLFFLVYIGIHNSSILIKIQNLLKKLYLCEAPLFGSRLMVKKMIKKILNKVNKRIFRMKVDFHTVNNPLKLPTDYNDGYCIIPDNLLHKDAVFYSFGAGEDVEVEAKLVKQYGCECYIFDPTPRSEHHLQLMRDKISAGEKMLIGGTDRPYDLSPELMDKIHFDLLGIWEEDTTVRFYEPKNKEHVSHSITNLQKTEDYIDVEVRQLKTIMAEKGHTQVDFLKMDIEGAEFKVIDNLLSSGVKFHALYLEFHLIDKGDYLKSVKHIQSYISKLEKAGYCFLSGVKNQYYSCIHQDWLNQHK